MNERRVQHVSHLLLELVRPSPVLSARTLARLAHEQEWTSLCHLISRFELGALVYERCRTQAVSPPGGVLEWLQTQYDQTANRNVRLLDELNTIISMLAVSGIPALVLKGPVLGHLGIGLLVRPFHDLDLLVKRCDLDEATTLLKTRGFFEAGSTSHPYHQIFVRPMEGLTTIVEVHFHLADRNRSYTPDIAGLWDRSTQLNLHGRAMTTLSLTDHLLVAMMQLPHHYWNLRLVTEIGTIVDRWKDVIDWDIAIERAQGWGMRALAGSTLHAVRRFFRVALPGTITPFAHPEHYFRRIQWQVVRYAILEQLEPTRSNSNRLASLIISDRWSNVVSLIARKASFADLSSGHASIGSAACRRLGGFTSNLPLLFRLMTEAAIARNAKESAGFAGTRVD